MIGDFNAFKRDVQTVSGAKSANPDDAIVEAVNARKLFIEVEQAEPPDFKKMLDGEAEPG